MAKSQDTTSTLDATAVPKMQQSEFEELRAQVKAVGRQDHILGHVLMDMLFHLGRAHGLDPQSEVVPNVAETDSQEEDNGN